MQYQVYYPINTYIYGPCFEDAIKSFVKLNYNIGLNSIIASDAEKRYNIQLKQYKADTRNRVSFDIYPWNGTYPSSLMNTSRFRFWNPNSSILYNGIPYNIGTPYLLFP